MSSISSIASSGLQAAQLRLDASAHNVANMNTPTFRRQSMALQAQPEQGGVRASVQHEPQESIALKQEAVEQISTTYTFKTNLQTLQTEDRMLGALLNTQA